MTDVELIARQNLPRAPKAHLFYMQYRHTGAAVQQAKPVVVRHFA